MKNCPDFEVKSSVSEIYENFEALNKYEKSEVDQKVRPQFISTSGTNKCKLEDISVVEVK